MKKLRIVICVITIVTMLNTTVFGSGVGSQNAQPNTPVSISVVLTNDITGGFSVTVPLFLPVQVDSMGVVTTATDAAVINNSTDIVKVSQVELQAIPLAGWSIKSFANDFESRPANTKEIGFIINNDISNDIGGLSFNQSNWANIAVGSSLPISYSAKLPVQTEAIISSSIAQVIFTIEVVQ